MNNQSSHSASAPKVIVDPKNIPALRELALTFDTRAQFQRSHQTLYKLIVDSGLSEQLFSHMTHPQTRWSVAELKRYASSFRTRNEWIQKHPASYYAAKRLGASIFEKIAPKSVRGLHSKASVREAYLQ